MGYNNAPIIEHRAKLVALTARVLLRVLLGDCAKRPARPRVSTERQYFVNRVLFVTSNH